MGPPFRTGRRTVSCEPWNDRIFNVQKPTSTVFQMFQELSHEVRKAVSEMGFKEPTEVQSRVVPLLLAGRSVVVQSKTGSGKTAAFGIPIAEMGRRSLVVVPTRELARQVSTEISRICKYKGLKVVPIYGGTGYADQLRGAREAGVIVGTPGRLLDLWGKGALKLEDFQFVVVDEADLMLEMGFIDDTEQILAHSGMEIAGFFSATIPIPIRGLAEKFAPGAIHVKVGEGEFEMAQVEHRFYLTEGWRDKIGLLREHLVPGTLVFTRTRERTARLSRALSKEFKVAELRGDMPQAARNRSMDGFRRGKFDVLVSTDLASRGIDVLSLREVVNFDVPTDSLTYLHRIGRTGRLGKGGVAITYVERDQLELFERIRDRLGLNSKVIRTK